MNQLTEHITEQQKLGKKLKEGRLRKGLTLNESGKVAGVSGVMIYYYESGKKNPPFNRLKVLCRLYDMDIGRM